MLGPSSFARDAVVGVAAVHCGGVRHPRSTPPASVSGCFLGSPDTGTRPNLSRLGPTAARSRAMLQRSVASPQCEGQPDEQAPQAPGEDRHHQVESMGHPLAAVRRDRLVHCRRDGDVDLRLLQDVGLHRLLGVVLPWVLAGALLGRAGLRVRARLPVRASRGIVVLVRNRGLLRVVRLQGSGPPALGRGHACLSAARWPLLPVRMDSMSRYSVTSPADG